MIQYQISSYRPRQHKRWDRTAEGARAATLYVDVGVVEVFSFPGNERDRAFTTLDMWIHPHLYTSTLPRAYHDRWINRLARDFAWECQRLHDKNNRSQ